MSGFTIKKIFTLNKIRIYLSKYKPTLKKSIHITPNHLVYIINKVSKCLFIKNCFVISIGIFKTFKFLDLNPTIVIGVNKKNGEFFSHSWVEIEGAVIYDRERSSFSEIYRIS